jgi:LacI family transcriptional regulator
MGMARRVSLREIGKRVGVSNVAVGAALGLLSAGSKVRIGVEKAVEIQRVAREMGYQPNKLARAFQKQQTKTVGVLFRVLSNPLVVNMMLDTIHRSLDSQGYGVSLRPFVGRIDRIEALAHDLVSWRVDGLIFVNVFEVDDPAGRWTGLNAWMDENGIPFVTVESTVKTSRAGVNFAVDTRDAYVRLAEHLIALGHRRLAAMGPAYFFQTARWAGVVEAAGRHAGVTVERLVVEEECGNGVHEQALAVARLAREVAGMKERATGILCSNDAVASSLISGLSDVGLSVPGDVSVTGYDNSEMAVMCRPQLTSVAWPGGELAGAAVETLLGLIGGTGGGGGEPSEARRFMGEVVLRGSTAMPRR